ncbi:RING-type E3 ubiquitin transferase [Trifolium repens]|nr:RING-type E3 ubiquitin transferase [Trifolium repens]
MSNRGDTKAISHKKCSNDLDCDICLEQVKDPVVTFCGHLYCWSCEVQQDGSVIPPRPSGPRSFDSTANVSEQPQQEQIPENVWLHIFLTFGPHRLDLRKFY